MNYIIGGGVTGLIESFYTGYPCIDKNFLGQLNMRFIPGVRLFKDSQQVVSFIERIFKELKEEVTINKQLIKVGYHYSDFQLRSEANIQFKKEYSLKTRGKEEYEDSFLSSGENQYYAIAINKLDCIDTYKLVFDKLLEVLKKRNLLIENKIQRIDVDKNTIMSIDNKFLQYDQLISTINLNILLGLFIHKQEQYEEVTILKNKLILLPKSFYKLPYQDSLYSYIYSVADMITRVSYFKDYRVAETNGEQLSDIYTILDKYENAPLQIKDSLNMTEIFGVELSGRYAQWSHSIKANQTIEKYEK